MKTKTSEHDNFLAALLCSLVTVPTMAGPTNCFADEEQTGEDAPMLELVEVTAPPQSERLKSVSIITKSQIESQHIQNMNDLLFSMIPGVNVARRSNLGFMGPNSGFRIRGLKRERVAVFVDGIPSQVNNHFHPLVDMYTPDMLERIEITKGTSGVLHGASAVGGVIDIYTPTVPLGLSGDATVVVGEFSTTEAQAGIGYGGEKGSLRISTSNRQTDGHRPNSAFDANTFNAKGSYSLNQTWELGFRASRTRANIENPGTESNPSLSKTTQDPDSLALTLDRRTGDATSFVALYWNGATVDRLRSGGGAPTGFQAFDENEFGLRFKHTMLRGAGDDLAFGLDAVKYDDERTNFPGTAPYAKNDESYFSPWIHGSHTFGETVLQGGVRVTNSSQFGTDVSPEIGLIRHIDQSLALRAQVGKSFRAPRVNDANAPFAVPNPDLESEEFWESELGLNKTTDKVAFNIAVWYRDGDNLIQTVGSGPTAQQVNTGEFEHYGLEASADLNINENFSAFLGLTLQNIEDEIEVPETMLDFGFNFYRGPFSVVLTSRYADDMLGNGAGVPLDSYYVADLHLAYRVNQSWEVFVNIDNLTDEEYETVLDYPQVPRAVFGGVRFNPNRER